MLCYWIKGTERRLRIGSWPDWSVMAARAEAKDIRRRIDRGEDPASEAQRPDNLEQRIADKALAFINQNLEPACYLYRHYSPGGDLLYVGVSLDAVERQRRHMKGAGWHNMICRIVIEPFETREQALEAEQIAIKTEFPKFNTTHNGRALFREIATLTRVPAIKKAGSSKESPQESTKENLKESMGENGPDGRRLLDTQPSESAVLPGPASTSPGLRQPKNFLCIQDRR